MQLIQVPEPFSPAFGEILYAVSLDENEKGEEISIFNSAVTQKIGIKKATESPTFTLNVSDYVRSQIRIEPFPRQDCAIIEAKERTYCSCIAYRDWASTRPHTAGIVPVGLNQPMGGNIVRYLGDDEQDEICWIAGEGPVFARALFPMPGSQPVEIHLGRNEVASPQMLALVINSPNLGNLLRQCGYEWNKVSRFTVEIHSAHRLMAQLEYRVRPRNPNKIRLAWWNRYGAIDFHSFECTRSSDYKTEKKQAISRSKNLNLSCYGHREMRAATACSTREQHEWLAHIAGAPQVWAEKNGAFKPVAIQSKSLPLYNPEKTDIEICFTEEKPVEYQSF